MQRGSALPGQAWAQYFDPQTIRKAKGGLGAYIDRSPLYLLEHAQLPMRPD